MHRLMCALLVATVMVSCEKNTHTPDKKTLEQLLTNGKWTLVGYGYDDNKSGTIEADENLIIDCQKDNTMEYHKNGSGTSLENQLVCQADPVVEFTWKFIDNEKAIEIAAQRLDIHTLTEEELHFVIEIPYITPALHTLYRR